MARPTNALDAYAREVTAKRVPAGKYHALACARHLRDRKREGTKRFPYRFDAERAQRFFNFAALLKHYKGEYAGQCIAFRPWQQFMLGSVIGWVHVDTGLRRFRTAYNEIPRKNGKSTVAATIALYVTFFDGEPGAEGYTVATKRDQAKIVFNDCKRMVESSGLKTRISVRVGNLHKEDTASKLEPLGADHDSTDGLNPSLIVNDELHAHKDRGLLDVMETATGARRQPLNFQITTAGNDPVSPCGDQHDYACKILDGILDDDTFFAFIAHADVGDDWAAERTWKKANPNFGISVSADDLAAKATKAKNMPAAAATFQQKHLNLWVNTYQPWLSVEGWRRGQSTIPRAAFAEALKGQPCWAGIDLSSKIDLTAVCLMFPPRDERTRWALLAYCFTPEDTLLERAHRDRAPYQIWKDAGWLQTTPGNRIDYDAIRALMATLHADFQIEQVGFDGWNAGNLEAHLSADGFDVLEIPQTVAQMSAASKDFEAEVLDGLVDADNNPLVAWCISNAVVQRDGKDNIYPTKGKSRGRIDPVIAAIMARKLAGSEPEAASVYETRGALVF